MTDNGTTWRHVLLVGHCGPDAYMLRSFVERHLPGARATFVRSQGELDNHLTDRSLLLVNRLLEGGFGTHCGVELIRRLAAHAERPVAMLVSNYPDAQQQAIEAGAAPGFGKAELGRDRTADLLRHAAGR